jgi:hypothetical protein
LFGLVLAKVLSLESGVAPSTLPSRLSLYPLLLFSFFSLPEFFIQLPLTLLLFPLALLLVEARLLGLLLPACLLFPLLLFLEAYAFFFSLALDAAFVFGFLG